MRQTTKVRALIGVLAVIVFVVSAARCGIVSDQTKQDAKKKVEAKAKQAEQQVKTGQEDLEKKVDELKKKVDGVQKDVNDLQEKVDELLKKVDAQDQQNQ